MRSSEMASNEAQVCSKRRCSMPQARWPGGSITSTPRTRMGAFRGSTRQVLAGSSFVAVQRWRHHMSRFEAMPREQQDHTVGRERDSNEEIDDAPESAHVKRTAQESFDPEAFVLRRSMPWAEGNEGGLVFTAFGHSFDAYEALLRRMSGAEDGLTDALFTFTEPETGAYFWCPPVKEGLIDLRAVGV